MFKFNLFVHSAGRGSIKEADGCSQWFLSLRSVVSGLEKPLLTGYQKLEKVEELIAFEPAEC